MLSCQFEYVWEGKVMSGSEVGEEDNSHPDDDREADQSTHGGDEIGGRLSAGRVIEDSEGTVRMETSTPFII